ncbi:U3 small nucleolar RNA-associated protein 6-domain-containing protein [Cubamyces lactineus]|nr:U3 small nucleolar RNA-associated protein 6-domain-containing protein [Cubamyces lactineus]
MERVQFQQEQMLTELKDLVQKGLFTQKEIKQIMQKRTAFETALVRRIPKKSDFLRYATYEMSLEALRRKRAERLKLPKGPPSVSDYALVRRQFQIFERALKKFKGDVGLWIQYIQVAKKEGARSLVGRITARALQLHPNVPALYVLAASHELEHLSPSAARALLQRGLRLNADSVEMWREYVRMELNFVESLRRRWSVLGIDVKGKGKESVKQKSISRNGGTDGGEESNLGGHHNEDADGMDVDGEEELGEDEAARKQILEGAIVKAVISNAVKALPKIELFRSLHEMISAYPSPPSLREPLLDHLHAHLLETLPSLPAAIKLHATRYLTPDLSGEALVDALRTANDVLSESVRTCPAETREGVATVYAEFIEEWCGKKDVDDNLKAYLITSLHLLIQHLSSPIPPPLLAAHVRLLTRHQPSLGSALLPPKVNSPEKILRVARKYTSRAPTNASVWLARLDAEKDFATQHADVDTAWAEARGKVEGAGLEDVWLWGLRSCLPSPKHSWTSEPLSEPATAQDNDSQAEVELLEHLLRDSKRIRDPAAASTVHEVLLIRYAAASHRALLYQIAHEHTSQAQPQARTIAQQQQPQQQERKQKQKQRDQVARATRDGDTTNDALTQARLARVRKLGTAYSSTARVWAEVFRQESEASSAAHARSQSGSESACGSGPDTDADGDARVLTAVYEFWRQTDGVEATVAWATWLLRNGRGKEAVAVVGRARSVLGETAGAEVERRWKTILDGDTGEKGEGAGEEGDGVGGTEADAEQLDADITVEDL